MQPKPHSKKIRVGLCARVLALAGTLVLANSNGWAADASTAEPIPFSQAVELALQHSGVMGIATINQWRARKSYEEVRNNYIPQFTIGSGLGYSYGFPLTLEGSAPSVANFTSMQSLFNLSLQQFMKAAKINWKATSLDVQDKRNAVILDTALTYAELAQLEGKLKTLQQAQAAADKAQTVSQERLQEGVDSRLDLTKSQLVSARIRLRAAEAQGQADVLREHLSKLLGVPTDTVAVQAESLPQFPAISQDDDLASRAVQNSPTVKLAQQKVASAEATAKGEHKAMLPTVDVATQYAFLARFNNYDIYYSHYLANNFSGGLNLRFPIFNPVQKAKAAEADADAMIAHKQAEITSNQVAENTLKLQRSLRQLSAARDVAKLEWQVAQGDLELVSSRNETGNSNPKELQNAQLEVDDKYAAYLDTNLAFERAELQLLRLTGELENWAIPPR